MHGETLKLVLFPLNVM